MRTLLLTLTVCLFVLPVQAKYSGGSGTAQDPYRIATAADLMALGETSADYDKHFVLTADVDLDPKLPGRKVFDKAVIAADMNDMQSGFQGTAFTGVFDGKGYVVRNVDMNAPTSDFVSLFGRVGQDAQIQNLGIEDVNIAGTQYVGGLVGVNLGTLSRCWSTGAVTGTGTCIGGLVGASGLVGANTVVEVRNCHSTCTVKGTGLCVGGLVGMNGYGLVAGCYSAGSVCGRAEGGMPTHVGGLVGYNNRGAVSDCYSTGSVNEIDEDLYSSTAAGGLVGYDENGTVSGCYSAGDVSGLGSYVGGLVGSSNSGSIITASFWDTQTSGQTESAGGTGRTKAEMQTAETFLEAGWDFAGETANGTEDIWRINEGKDYPILSWQGPAGMVFVDIPAGTFQMGDHDGVGYPYERPIHTVTLSGFQTSKYETTNAQYAAYLNAAMSGGLIQVVSGAVYASSDSSRAQPYCDTQSASSFSQIKYSQGRFTVLSRDGKGMSDHPVVRVSWYGAKAFCDYYGCRLPTEAEWEYAARGGYHDPYWKYPWGSNVIDCSKANYRNGSSYCNPLNLTFMPYTSPVSYYGAQGAYGLCDMSGNVWEWCQDWCDTGYYSRSPAGNPTGPNAGVYRVLRGGSWDYIDNYCRVSFRHWNSPDRRTHYYGFRVCR